MSEKKKAQPSYNCLRESLRCANAEARGYLDELVQLRKERMDVVAERDRWKRIGQGADELCSVLIKALKDAQAKG